MEQPMLHGDDDKRQASLNKSVVGGDRRSFATFLQTTECNSRLLHNVSCRRDLQEITISR